MSESGNIVVFHPGPVNLDNLTQTVAAGREKMPANGRFRVEMGDSPECNTAVVCLLIELLRAGLEKGCRLEVSHPSSQLESLISLYHLNALLLSAPAAVSDTGHSATRLLPSQ